MTIVTLMVTLFFIMSPFEDIPVIITVLREFTAKKQRYIILREAIIALFILSFFALAGEQFLKIMNISTSTVSIAGGIILFFIAIPMIFPIPKPSPSKNSDPFIVPLAIPIIADPATISTVILFSRNFGRGKLMLSLGLVWILALALYLTATIIKRFLKKRGTQAIEKLGGIILVMIAVQMLTDGIKSAIAN
ncbi:MarC family protein [bacterium]|jgi:multiple antibiotic resistance protein|nr:MarC family protein [bacterium]